MCSTILLIIIVVVAGVGVGVGVGVGGVVFLEFSKQNLTWRLLLWSFASFLPALKIK